VVGALEIDALHGGERYGSCAHEFNIARS